MSTNRPATPPPGSRPPQGKTLFHQIGGRRPAVLIGGGAAVLVALYALYQRSQGAGAGSATNATTGQAAGTYDSSLSDIEAQWENQLEGLQNEIANLQGTGRTPPGPPSTRRPVILGGTPPTGIATPVTAGPAPAASQTHDIVRVQSGNTLSGIAARFGETWQQVWAYNLKPGVRPAATDRILRQRGPNLLYPGEQIYIPEK